MAIIPSRALGSTVMIEQWNVEEQMSLFGLQKNRWFLALLGVEKLDFRTFYKTFFEVKLVKNVKLFTWQFCERDLFGMVKT